MWFLVELCVIGSWITIDLTHARSIETGFNVGLYPPELTHSSYSGQPLEIRLKADLPYPISTPPPLLHGPPKVPTLPWSPEQQELVSFESESKPISHQVLPTFPESSDSITEPSLLLPPPPPGAELTHEIQNPISTPPPLLHGPPKAPTLPWSPEQQELVSFESTSKPIIHQVTPNFPENSDTITEPSLLLPPPPPGAELIHQIQNLPNFPESPDYLEQQLPEKEDTLLKEPLRVIEDLNTSPTLPPTLPEKLELPLQKAFFNIKQEPDTQNLQPAPLLATIPPNFSEHERPTQPAEALAEDLILPFQESLDTLQLPSVSNPPGLFRTFFKGASNEQPLQILPDRFILPTEESQPPFNGLELPSPAGSYKQELSHSSDIIFEPHLVTQKRPTLPSTELLPSKLDKEGISIGGPYPPELPYSKYGGPPVPQFSQPLPSYIFEKESFSPPTLPTIYDRLVLPTYDSHITFTLPQSASNFGVLETEYPDIVFEPDITSHKKTRSSGIFSIDPRKRAVKDTIRKFQDPVTSYGTQVYSRDNENQGLEHVEPQYIPRAFITQGLPSENVGNFKAQPVKLSSEILTKEMIGPYPFDVSNQYYGVTMMDPMKMFTQITEQSS